MKKQNKKIKLYRKKRNKIKAQHPASLISQVQQVSAKYFYASDPMQNN
jgi:hypothetical protein